MYTEENTRWNGEREREILKDNIRPKRVGWNKSWAKLAWEFPSQKIQKEDEIGHMISHKTIEGVDPSKILAVRQVRS